MTGPPATARYTIAWIAALPHERAAALELLDEEHRRPKDFKKNPSDGNSYSWGRIGDHNIVIASLPEGVYGTTTAAVTAACLVSSLPFIRIGLLVGIGAGITGETLDENGHIRLERDVLLGDIVVSKPENGKGGVVLHDVVKMKMVDGEQRAFLNGHLNQPPNALLHALGALQTQHLRRPSKIPNLLAIFEGNEFMKDTFGYPGPEHDPIRTPLQTSNPNRGRDAPRVHYGTIASGNKLIKNAQERNDIVNWLRENNVEPICLEMEAGGLMNNFPCIVIRGICDYADERKNDTWQPYAAATAAAFAKELLSYLDVDEIEGEDTLAERLGQLQSDMLEVKTKTSRLVDSAAQQEMKELQNWLCPTDYTPRLHEHQSNYHPGTAAWFFEDERYKTWVQHGQSSVLLCEGHPGTGKSTLASYAIEVLQHGPTSDSSMPVLYLFFDYKMQDTQTTDHVLCSLLRQLVRFLPKVPEDLWKAKKNNKRLTLERLHSFLEAVLSDLDDHFVVFDALDEASPLVRDDLIPRLCNLAQDYKLHFLATSRCLPAIQRKFGSYPRLEIAASSSDVDSYVRHRTQDFRDDRLRTPDLVDATVAALLARCSGMQVLVPTLIVLSPLMSACRFLLARLLMDILVARVATPGSLKRALKGLPSGEDAYNTAYDSILERVTSQQGDFKQIGLECLAWVVFAKRPLSPKELGHALATRGHEDVFDLEDVPSVENLPSLCAGLITINRKSDIVGLVHATAYEYLVEVRNEWFPKVDFLLADRCLKYLMSASAHLEPDSLSVEDYSGWRGFQWEEWGLSGRAGFEIAPVLLHWPFMHYAVVQWPRHAEAVEMDSHADDEQVKALALRITDFPARRKLCFWLGIAHCVFNSTYGQNEYRMPDRPTGPETAFKRFTIWHAMAAWDLAHLCSFLLTKENYANSRYGGKTPLILAAQFGSTNTARLLLNHTCAQADETLDWDYHTGSRSVLWHAAGCGHAQFVKMLLEQAPSLDCNAAGDVGRTPLMLAATEGHIEVVKILLDIEDIDVYQEDDDGISPLLTAASSGGVKSSKCFYHAPDDVVRTLLSHRDIDVNKPNELGESPLFRAVTYGRDSVCRTLLSHPDIDINKKNTRGQSVLHIVCQLGSIDILQMFLDTGRIELEAVDEQGATPLASAAWIGRTDIVRMLAAKGANVLVRDNAGLTALFLSVARGHAETVREMLKHIGELHRISLTSMDEKVLRGAYLRTWVATQGYGRSNKVMDVRSASTCDEVGSDDRGRESETNRINESLTALRQIAAVDRLFDSVGQMIDSVHLTRESDRRALSRFVRRQTKCYPHCPYYCDCTESEQLHAPVFWLCSLCEEKENPGLSGRLFLPECVDKGAWCNDPGHILRKVDLRPLLEGNPSEFVYPLPTRTHQSPAAEVQSLSAAQQDLEYAIEPGSPEP